MSYFRRLPFIETTFCALANASSRATLLLGFADKRTNANSFSDSHICACSGCGAAACTDKLSCCNRRALKYRRYINRLSNRAGRFALSNPHTRAATPPREAACVRAAPVEFISGGRPHLHLLSDAVLDSIGQGAGRSRQRSAKRLCFVNVRKLFKQLPIFQVVFPFSRHPISAGLSHFVQVDDVRAHSSALSVVVFQP